MVAAAAARDGGSMGGGGDAQPVAVAGRRHLMRAPGSWSSGVGGGSGTGGGRARSPTGFMRGGGGGSVGSVGSPSSTMGEAIAAAIGAAAMTSAPPTQENRNLRRQSISRRLSRGAGRLTPSTGRRLDIASATDMVQAAPAPATGKAEGASAGAVRASPTTARAAAQAAAEDEILEAADVRVGRLARRNSAGAGRQGRGGGGRGAFQESDEHRVRRTSSSVRPSMRG